MSARSCFEIAGRPGWREDFQRQKSANPHSGHRLTVAGCITRGTIAEIYGRICESNLYTFNTPTPEHVLRTEIRRKTQGLDRVDPSKEVMFKLVGDETYDVMIMKEPTKRRAGGSTKRVQRATDKRDIIGLLTSEGSGAFSEIWRVLLFAAAVGFKNKRREALAAVESGDAIRQESFENSFVWPGMLYLLGLVETNGADGRVPAQPRQVGHVAQGHHSAPPRDKLFELARVVHLRPGKGGATSKIASQRRHRQRATSVTR